MRPGGPAGDPADPAGGPARVVDMQVGLNSPRAQADLVFVIDTTGSMDDKIDGLIRSCQRFVDALASRRVDWQAAVVGFGDLTVRGDRVMASGFSSDIRTVKARLRGIPRFSGGNNVGESSLEALRAAMGLAGQRPQAMTVLILITDEPALQRSLRPSPVTQELRRRGALTFVVSPPLDYFKAMAVQTGGAWFRISPQTDLSSILRVFEDLAGRVASTVSTVQRLAGGSVRGYLSLPPDQRRD